MGRKGRRKRETSESSPREGQSQSKKSRSGQSNKITDYVQKGAQRKPNRDRDSDGNSDSDVSCDEDMNETERRVTGVDELKVMMQAMITKQDVLTAKVTDVMEKLALLNTTVTEHGVSLNYAHEEINGIKDGMKLLEAEQQTLKKRLSAGSESAPQRLNEIKQLNDQVQNLERKSREKNLRLVGYKENEREDCQRIVEQVLSVHLKMDPKMLEVAHRTGRRIIGKPRHIIFRVSTVQCKIDIMKSQRECLKDKQYYIADDLTKQDLETKKRLRPVIQEARNRGDKWTFKNGRLYIKGIIHVEEQSQSRHLQTFHQGQSRPQNTMLPRLPPRLQNKTQQDPEVITASYPLPRRHRSLPQRPTHQPRPLHLPHPPHWDSTPLPPWDAPLPSPPPPPLHVRSQQQNGWARQSGGQRDDREIGYVPDSQSEIGYIPDSQEIGPGQEELYYAEPSRSRVD